ncbi:MAG TPA: metal-dependent hydrolase [Planctomycetota bacterium]|nr:metal-dependent hydrolase [Planctomycetota bacterium]
MSSIVGHGLVGMSLWALARRTSVLRALEHKAWLAGAAIAACLPDLDALVGLPHRGPTHTLGFALGMGGLAALIAAGRGLRREAALIGLAGLLIVWSHAALDLFTGGGPDVALFRPFWNREFRPFPGGLPLTGYSTEVGGLFGLLFNPWTICAMLLEGAIFGPLFAATVAQRRRSEIGLALVGASLWILLALAASR